MERDENSIDNDNILTRTPTQMAKEKKKKEKNGWFDLMLPHPLGTKDFHLHWPLIVSRYKIYFCNMEFHRSGYIQVVPSFPIKTTTMVEIPFGWPMVVLYMEIFSLVPMGYGRAFDTTCLVYRLTKSDPNLHTSTHGILDTRVTQARVDTLPWISMRWHTKYSWDNNNTWAVLMLEPDFNIGGHSYPNHPVESILQNPPWTN
jgi:hypothetical protein